MQQMNHVLARRAQEGFAVERFDCGVNQRPTPGGDAAGAASAPAQAQGGGGGGGGGGEGCDVQHNLYYNIVLKKVVPLLPVRRPAPAPQQAQAALHARQQHQQHQQHQQQHQQFGLQQAVAAAAAGLPMS
jgi:hypothetical protein